MQQFLPIGKASSLLGVSVDTIRNWDNAGKINVYRTPGGERRIPFEEIERLTNSSSSKNTKPKIKDLPFLLKPKSQIEPQIETPYLINPPSVISPQPIPKKPSFFMYTTKVFALATTITLLLLFTANKLPGTAELIQKYVLRNSEVTSSISNVVVPEKPAPPIITAGIGSITGTPGRITVLGTDDLTVNIATTYGGQKSISTLGTITTGIWNGIALTDPFVSDTLTVGEAASVNAGAVNFGTLGTSGVTLGLGSFGAITGSLADANVFNKLTIDSTGSIAWTALTSYPSSASCGAGKFVRTIADTITCAANVGGSSTLQDVYDNGSNITTINARDIEFDLADTATDSDFIVDILGAGNVFEIQDGSTPIFTIADTGQFTFTGTGASNLATFDISNASADGVSIDVQSSANTEYALNVTSNNGATTGLYVRADGNIGIGTTNPQGLLTLGGAIMEAITRENSSSSLALYGGASESDGAYFRVSGIDYPQSPGQGSAEFVIRNEPGTANTQSQFTVISYDGVSSWTRRFVILGSSGNIGIGTVSPDAELDVAGLFRTLAGAPSFPSSGTGLEIYYDNDGGDDLGMILSYDRSGGTYKSMALSALTHNILSAATSGDAVSFGATLGGSVLTGDLTGLDIDLETSYTPGANNRTGINIDTITGGGSSETAINIGSGWDNIFNIASGGGGAAVIDIASFASTRTFTLPDQASGDFCISSGNCPGVGANDKRVATVIVGVDTGNPATSSKNASQADYVADGTDDHLDIEQAISDLPTGGGVVYLLEGTYSIGNGGGSSGIDITKSNVSIIGAGKATILQRGWDAASNDGVITVGDGGTTSVSGITIADLTINGVKTTYNTSDNNNGIYFKAKVSYSTIRNTYVYDNDGDGIYLYGFGGPTDQNFIQENDVRNNGDSGITISFSHNTTVIGNNVEGNSVIGIVFAGANNNSVAGNNVEGNSGYGFYIDNSKNNTFSGNNVGGNSGYGFHIVTNADNNTVTGNTIESNGTDGIYINNSDGNLISSNTITDTAGGGYGINVSSATSNDNYLVGNEISGAGFTSEINDLGTGTTIQHRDQFEIETAETSGNIFNLDWTGATIATGSITGFYLDFSNLTADGTNPVYGLSINDPAGTTGSTEYGIYQQGTNWDYGAYFEDDVYFDTSVDVEGQFSLGSQVTLAANDTTPDVSAASTFITANTVPTTITDFDAGAGSLENGQIIFVEIGDGNTVIDCDGGNINCGTTDITMASGDFTTFFYDGTDWNLVSLMDDSDNQNAGSGFDIAEWFPASEELEPGDIVSIDSEPSTANSLMKSGKEYDAKLIGIVSTEPGLTLGEPAEGFAYPIALTGRVPIKVSTENGPIAIGDPLTSSSTPGVAMKATKSGPIIGKALNNYNDSGVGKIIVFVSVGWYVAPLEQMSNGGSQVASVLDTLTVNTIFLGDNSINIDQNGNIRIDGGLNITGDVVLDGNLVLTGNIEASSISTDELKIGGKTSGTGSISPNQSSVQINNNSVSSDSKVIVTFNSDWSPATRYWVQKNKGNFKLYLDKTVPNKVTFDWLIIGGK